MNQHKNDLYFTKKILSFGMSFCEFLTSKGDDMGRKIVEEYFTFVRLEM